MKRPKPKPRVLSIKEIASTLNLTPSRIQQLVQEGLPKKLRGRYDQDECTGWYIRYLQALVEKKSIVDEGGRVFASEREERLRLLRADADLREMELAAERGLVIAISDYESTLADLILTTKARIMAIAPRVAPEVTGQTSRVMVQALIEKACKEALAYLAKPENHKGVGSTEPSERDS